MFFVKVFDRGVVLLKVDKLVIGYNVDDIVEIVFLNIFRGDIVRLSWCILIIIGEDGLILRCKFFKYIYEKEIVIYFFCCFKFLVNFFIKRKYCEILI